nr:copper amine oxidase [Chlamydomonas reinhardtii]
MTTSNASVKPSALETATVPHPLEQLSADEVRRAAEVVRRYAAGAGLGTLRFNTVMLREPPKRYQLAFERGAVPRPPRVAEVVLVLPQSAGVAEALVRLALPPAAAEAAPLGPPPPPASVAVWPAASASPSASSPSTPGAPFIGPDTVAPPCAELGAQLLLWRKLEGVHPLTSPDDNSEAEAIMKASPVLRQAVAERYGLSEAEIDEQLMCDTWACHNAPRHLAGRRLMQGFLYLKLRGGHDNEYAHPLDLTPIVDLNTREVVHMDAYDRPCSVHRGPDATGHNYSRSLVDTGVRPWRDDIKPLHVVQPEGPSFSLDGPVLSWQRWRMVLGFNGREGLVLHNLTYTDPLAPPGAPPPPGPGRVRPVLHRASLVEMAVPYGDPHVPYTRKCALDVGDYGFGLCANSLELGCDCLGHITYMDAVVNNAKGEAVVIRKAVCIHEEDAGIMWKHWDCRTGAAEVRRSRRLVVSQVSTFMNYEYAMYWYFYQDGTIHFELKLTGILSTSVCPEGEAAAAAPFGVRVAPGVNATVHQHFFCMRLDPAIDDTEGGRHVVVAEVEAVPLPPGGDDNPHRNGFRMVETELTRVAAASRNHNFNTARHWSMKNPFSLNPISGRPVSYRLMPAASPAVMAAPDSLVARRAEFARKQLWVTPHVDGQRYAAGEHVVQSEACMGLGVWTAQDAPLLGSDPVVWYSFGVTHAPRVEDFPVMPVEVCGFSLKPDGFFAGNPAVDLPPSRDPASKEEMGRAGGAGGGCCALPKSKL